VIVVNYTLQGDDGEIRDEERHSEQVPRVGELVTFDFNRSYQVVDVLWHLNEPGTTRVTVTACELGWHENLEAVMRAWRKAHRA